MSDGVVGAGVIKEGAQAKAVGESTTKKPKTKTLSRPVEYDGRTVRELPWDLEELTGEDIETAEREYMLMGGMPGSLSTSPTFHMYIIACVAKEPVELIKKISARDLMPLTIDVQGFFLGMEV